MASDYFCFLDYAPLLFRRLQYRTHTVQTVILAPAIDNGGAYFFFQAGLAKFLGENRPYPNPKLLRSSSPSQ